MAAFTPISPGGTYILAVTNVSATAFTLPAKPTTIRIFNAGTNTAFIEIGGVVATIPVGGTPGSMPLAPGAGTIPLLLEKGQSTTISVISSVGTTTLYVTIGHGDTVG